MNDTTNTIQQQAMLFSLTVKQWSGKAKDKDACSKVEADNGAIHGALDLRKKLVFDQLIDDIKKLGNEARQEFYALSLPWMDDGRRLVSAKNYIKAMQKMDEFKRKFDTMVNKVESNYEIMKDEARVQLGSLFRDEDYPQSVMSKYEFAVRVEPIASVDDIRVGLGEGERDKIADRLKKQIETAQAVAKRDIYERVRDCVARIAESLPKFDPSKKGAEKGTFRDTLVTNVADLVDGLDGLNFDNDQSITALGASLRKLTQASADELREDKAKREDVTRTAKDILDSMAGYCGIVS